MQNRINNIVSIFIFLIIGWSLNGQKLVDIEFLQTQTASSIEITYNIPAEYDIELYSIRYETKDVHGVQDTASGLMIVPQNRNFQYPMMCYQHGTLPDRNTAMSNLQAGDVTLARIYGSFGFIVVAPDMLGMLESRGFHPYVHAASEASAGVDMMLAVRDEALLEIGSSYNDRCFLTGYSQGGHAAMALHRSLQNDYPGEFNIIASMPMSGPYSISEKMIEFTLGEMEYFFVAYLPNVALSYKTAYPDLLADVELEDIFKEEYLEDIYKFQNEEIDLIDLNTALIDKLIQNTGASIPNRMLHDSTLMNIRNNPDHPLSMALADNDVYDWKPDAWHRMYYCQGDDQVFWENATLAEEVMNNNGASNSSAVNLSDTEDHGGCVFPAVTAALEFTFILRGIITSTDELLDASQIQISPNPAQTTFDLQLDKALDLNNSRYRLIDLNGKMIKSNPILNHRMKIEIDELNTGLYIFEIESPTFRGIQKIIKE